MKTDYFSSSENNKGTTSVQTYTTTFTTPATIVNQPYVQLYRTGYVSNSANQDLDRFDEFILVAANGGGIGITGATGATFLSGSAYAPEGVLAAALTDGPIDVTSLITNPTFDSGISGWNTPIGEGKPADNKQDETRNFYESWNATPKEGRMYQTLSNLPSGTYELSMIAFADQLGTMTAANTVVAVYAQGQEVGTTNSSYIRPNYVNSVNFTEYKAYAFVDATGKLEIGMRQYTPAQFRWLGMDNVALKYISVDNLEESQMLSLYQTKWTATTAAMDDVLDDATYEGVLGKERADLTTALDATVSELGDYKTKADALLTAYNTFIGAKDIYDACVTEYEHYVELSGEAAYNSFITSSTTGEAVLNAIKTAEYTAVTTKYDTDGSALFIADWDVTNFDALDAQHWSSQTRTYYDKWSGSAFNCSISKTVTLPEGHYAFYAAGRGQANSASAVTLKVAISGGSTLTQTYTMKGDTGYGINTSGAADFTAAGEGHTYANNNNGRGWEWRYIVFDLNAETEVTLSIEGEGNNSWVSACDTKLLTYENVEVSRRLYVANKTTAETARDNSTYENVNGAERAALLSAIGATPEETYSGYLSAANALETATDNFIAAKDSYDGLVTARTTGATYTTVLWPHATTAKKDALDDAIIAAAPADAADAVTKTNAIVTAYRQFVESNGLAEGVAAVDYTSTYLAGADPDTNTGWTNGIGVDRRDGEVYTKGDGTTSGKYYDGGWSTSAAVDINMTREITLPAGQYQLQITARGSADLTSYTMSIGGETVNLPKEGAGVAVGTFGHGWSDKFVVFESNGTDPLTLAITATSTEYQQWISFNRLRLVRLGVESVEVTSAGYATFSSPYALDFTGKDIKAYIATANGTAGVNFNLINKVPANTGVLLCKEGGTDSPVDVPVFDGTGADATTGNVFVPGTGVAVASEGDGKKNYILSSTEAHGVGFYPASGKTVNEGKAYISVPASVTVKGFITLPDFEDDATGINAIDNGELTIDNAAIYNLAGQRISKVQKGINIINGRKVLY